MDTLPVDVVFRDMDPSPMVDVAVRRWATRLARRFDRVLGCQVVIGQPHRHHERGRRFHVRVRVSLPGSEIVVSHDPGDDETHDDVYVAIRDAFRAARRQLEQQARRMRSHAVHAEGPPAVAES